MVNDGDDAEEMETVVKRQWIRFRTVELIPIKLMLL